MIDILVPCLNRPANAQPLADSLTANTTIPYRLLFICSEGDTDQIAACEATGANILIVKGGRSEYPRKMNHGYRNTTHPFLLLAADDDDFQPGWDVHALAAADTGAGVVGLNDMNNRNVIDGHFSTIPLVSRAYIAEQGGSLDGPGVLLHEGYDHNFVDRELCGLAQARHEWVFARDAKIRHVHKGRHADATYRKGAANFQADHELFMRRAKEWGNVGLMPQELRFQRRAHRGVNRRNQPEPMDVSILVATYGSDEWEQLALRRAVPSTENQGAEVVVVHEPDGSVASSRNAAAEAANREWLCFLDADDELAFGYCREMSRIHARNPNPRHLYTPAVSYIQNGRRKPAKFWPECSLDTGNWMVIGTLIRRDVFREIGGFHELPHGLEDWNLWGRAVRYGCVPVKVPRAIYVAHHNPESKHHQLRLDKAEYGVWYEKAKAGIAAQETLA